MDRKKMGKNRDKMKKTSKKIAWIMPSSHDYSSRDEWRDACWQKILLSKELLQLLVTFHERRDIVMRALALDRLMVGKSYAQISKELWLSSQTISGIKKALKENSYRSYLERSKKERKKRKYSSNSYQSRQTRPEGRPKRTKYGTIYLPW